MSNWYISPTGSDTTGNGSLNNPYATVTKCLEICNDGDTIRALNGTYNITTRVNITKQITLISDSEINTDVIFYTSSVNMFYLQNSNITITKITIQIRESGYYAIIIDIMSYGSTEPTFWINNTISYCKIEYYDRGIVLTGSFNVINNTFRRYNINTFNAYIIKIDGHRGNSNISYNLFYDEFSAFSIIYLGNTNISSGTYKDKCSSRGGSVEIFNNTVTFTSQEYNNIFISIERFNGYIFPDGPDEVYNLDTRLSLLVHDNTVTFSSYGYLMRIITNDDNSFHTFDLTKIYNNSVTRTNHGALFLTKTVNPSSIINISSFDLERQVFRIYDNSLSSTSLVPIELYRWDALNTSKIKSIDPSQQININDEVIEWKNSLQFDKILINAGNYHAIFQIDYRNNMEYPYVKTIMNTNGYLKTDTSNEITANSTLFIVFKETECTYNVINESILLSHDISNNFFSLSHSGQNMYIKNKNGLLINTSDISTDYCRPRVWAIRYNSDNTLDCIIPYNGDVTNGVMQTINLGVTNTYRSSLKIGNSNNSKQSSVDIYEIKIYVDLNSDEIMMDTYLSLQNKWGIRSNAVKVNNWDSSNANSIQDINGDPVVIGNPITKWVDSVSNINIVNAGSYPATLETEIRDNISYNYIKTVSNIGGYLVSEYGIIKDNYTMYIVFREDIGTHENNPINLFMNDGTDKMRTFHNVDNIGYIQHTNYLGQYRSNSTNDYQASSYDIRVWAIKINGNIPYRCIFPSKGATSFGVFKDFTYAVSIPNLSVLKFGQSVDQYPSSICLYEIVIYDGIQTDNEMMTYYNYLHDKWRVDRPIVPVKVFNWDASNNSSIVNDSGQPVIVGNPITKWIDNISNNNIVNGGYDKALLESETRNNVSYNYIKTISGNNGYLGTVNEIVKTGCTMYIVFREADNGYYQASGSKFLTNYDNTITGYHNLDGVGSFNGELIGDNIIGTNYTTRIWAIRFNVDMTCTYVVPLNGDPTVPNMITGSNSLTLNTSTILYFGQVNNNYPTSICLYEIIVYDGLQSDTELLSEYFNLQIKWGISSNPVKTFNWDSSNSSTILDENGNPVTVGNPITRWVDSISSINFVNAGSYPATLESEIREGVTYNYIKNVSNTDGYIISESGIIKNDYTMYLVFKENTDSYQSSNAKYFMNDDTDQILAVRFPGSSNLNNQDTSDIQNSSYSIRIWAIKVIGNYGFRCIFPSYGATSFGIIKNLNDPGYLIDLPTLSALKLGRIINSQQSVINIYELAIFNGSQTDDEMMNQYELLHNKWNIDAPIVPVKVFNFDTSDINYILDQNGNPISIGDPVTKWMDNISNVFIINNNLSNKAILKSEDRNGLTYNYIETISNPNSYLKTVNGIIRKKSSFYMVFRESENGYYQSTGSKFLTNYNNKVSAFHKSDGSSIINGENINDTSISNYSIRIWSIRFNEDGTCTYIVPSNGNTSILNLITGTNIVSLNDPNKLYFGQFNNDYPTSICLYEIIVYDGLQSDNDMIDEYNRLLIKWGITNSVKLYNWDSSNSSTILDENGNPVTVGNPITRWLDPTGNINFVNAGSYPATLESEVRNGIAYNYIKTISNTNGYLLSESGIIKNDHTMYIVFREEIGSHELNPISSFMNDDTGYLYGYHNNTSGFLNYQDTEDIQSSSYTIRIWAFKIITGTGLRCIFPSKGATSFGLFKDLYDGSHIPQINSYSKLKLGQIDDTKPSSICLYEVIIYEGLQNDTEMMLNYNLLHNKWKPDIPIIPINVFNFDASVNSSILDNNNNPVIIGNTINTWTDIVSNVNIINGSYYDSNAILESETRNSISYRYIKTINNIDRFIKTKNGIINVGSTMYMVFREAVNGFNSLNGSRFLTNYNNTINGIHNQYGYTIINNEVITSYEELTNLSSRIWAIRFNLDGTCTYIVPLDGDPTVPYMTTGGIILTFSEPNILYFGHKDNYLTSSICLYEIRIYDGTHSDPEMLAEYATLQSKWGII